MWKGYEYPDMSRKWLLALIALVLAASFTVFAQELPSAPGEGAGAPEPAPQGTTAPTIPKDYSDQPFVIQQMTNAYSFNNDGTGTRTDQMKIKVQSEAGVQQLGQLRFGYNSANQDLKIDYVHVIKPDGKVIVADTSAVQDITGEVARVAPMYTDYHEKHLAVPGLRPGDVLEYETQTITHTALASGEFWMEQYFNDDVIILNEQLIIDVPKDRKIILKTQPRFDNYTTTEKGDRRIYTWNYQNLITRQQKEDQEREKQVTGSKRPHKKRDEVAAVQLTTFDSWNAVAKWYWGLEKNRRAPTPEITAKALELTKDKATPIEKIQALYDYVAKNYRYVSLSLGLGRYQPHFATDVLNNEYGDCKDKHTLLAALLQAIGYHLNTVLIHSQHKLDVDVPSPSQFDHVIGNLKLGDQTIWMDTTTEVAPMGMLALPIRNKLALQVEPDGTGKIVRTPIDIPFKSFTKFEIDGKVSELGTLQAHVTRISRGDQELMMRSAFRSIPESSYKDFVQYVSTTEGLEGTISNIKTSPITDTSTPFKLEYDISVPNFFDWSGKESKVKLPIPNAYLPTGDPDDTEPIKLGAPQVATGIAKIEIPAKFKITLPMPVTVKRDYAEYESTSSFENGVLTAERVLTTKVPELPSSRADDLAALSRIIASDNAQMLRVEVSGADAAKPPAQAKPAELDEAAWTAFNARKFKLAAELYERITQLDPKNKTAWNNLGRAYMAMLQLDRAETALKKAIEINPYDEYAYNNLGHVYELEQKFDLAEQYYRKQLEVNPLDQYAHANLGQLFESRHEYAKAVPELEKAVTITPDNPYTMQLLGVAYLKTGQTDKAMAQFDKAVEKAPEPTMWNNVAYVLAEANQNLPRAEQYAESAVSSTETLLRNLSIEQDSYTALATSAALATYWDTAGWVYFHEGQLDKAQKYLSAAWNQTQQGEVGDHLGQLYEKRGDKQKAIQMYAEALAARGSVPETRGRLQALLPPGTDIDKFVASKAGLLDSERTIKLGPSTVDGNAEFVVVFDSKGDVLNLKLTSNKDEFASRVPELKALHYPVLFPNGDAVRMARKGVLLCTKADGCSVVLFPSDADLITASYADVKKLEKDTQ